jgi:hypothetical protein
MKIIISEEQYNLLIYKRRFEDIKNLIDNLADNPSLYYDEDEFFEDVKDLVYKNVYLSGNKYKELSWDKIDRDDLMLFIDEYFEEYIKDIFRRENNPSTDGTVN